MTGLDPVPFESDTIIVAQMLAMVEEGYRPIQVICEDTNVFVLLLHHYEQQHILSNNVPPVDVLMQYPPYPQHQQQFLYCK